MKNKLWQRLQSGTASIALAVLLVLCVAGYAFFPHPLLGFLGFACIIALVAVDLFYPPPMKKKTPLKNNLVEIGIALAVAVGAWLLLGFVLRTATPLNVVTSCSMLPSLDRGDLIILEGSEPRAPMLVLEEDLSRVEYHLNYVQDHATGTLQPFYSMTLGSQELFSYRFTPCTITQRPRPFTNASPSTQRICTNSMEFKGREIGFDKENDVIVFTSTPSEYGLIIHRVFLKIRAADGVYYLTKGDNNPLLDQQSGVRLVPEKDVQGRVALRVPFAGYLKLFLFLQFEEPPGCQYLLQQ